MSIIINPSKYDKKIPTNIRLDESIKDILQSEAKVRNTTMSDIINEVLIKRYSKILDIKEAHW